MKLEVLNKSLTYESGLKGVRFIFPPIALPINKDGEICSQNDSHIHVHYVTLVYVEDHKMVEILEFNEDVLNALKGYSYRHQSLIDLEILFSRESNGELRMTIGRTSNLTPMKEIQENYKHFYDSLSKKYLERYGYQTHDFKSE